MKNVSHYNKVMWGLYCEYSYIPTDVWYETKYVYEWIGDLKTVKRSYQVKHGRRSAAEWSFIHSKYYYITKIDPIYCGSLEEFATYLVANGRYSYLKNPYKYKKNGWHFKGSSQCGKNLYRWRYTSGNPSKYKRNIDHKKKTLSEKEQVKRDWREKKKVRKDKSKTFKSWSNRSAGKYYKKLSNQMHRTKEREAIKKLKFDLYTKGWWEERVHNDGPTNSWEYNYAINDWDSFYIEDYKYYLDPWMWD